MTLLKLEFGGRRDRLKMADSHCQTGEKSLLHLPPQEKSLQQKAPRSVDCRTGHLVEVFLFRVKKGKCCFRCVWLWVFSCKPLKTLPVECSSKASVLVSTKRVEATISLMPMKDF